MSLMGDAIKKQILSDICQCKYFSILADETTDVSQTEQLSLSVRFIKDTKVHEEFLCFVPVSSTTGKDLASSTLTQLSQLGLNLEHMRGQGYDGASTMSGKYRGVQARVKEMYPLAMYTNCCNHVLKTWSLVLHRSCQLLEMRWQVYWTYAFFCRVLHSAYRYFKTMLKENFQVRLLLDRS